ncbi:hypothetical protein P3875_08445 [Myroides sp. JBRI-B21084]|uniref:hypothetical protein n=1 Tax=Myroides sp. JBRI-B21084 TaxID=3119977 RepID=UPI0026E37DB5|nr:hypothetical protein [Paenimyroides cloacae]WKW45812.1 hypothetical protein P3875_08445 [Paenimyroides cloacae]
MKKILSLFAIATAVTACNDGDLVFENLNFNDKEIQKCSTKELYFKTNNNELLLIDFSNGVDGTDLDTLSDLNVRKTLNTSQSQIYYRTYDGAVNLNTICATLAPANPKVISEYQSLGGGNIHYTRTLTPVVTDNAVNVNYAFTINFENITLSNGTSNIKYTTLPFGTFNYKTNKLSFNFNTNIQNCSSVLTARNLNEVMQLQLPENFVFPTTNQTQTLTLNNSQFVRYFVFDKTIPSDVSFCDFPSQTIAEDWQATNGTVQITTTVLTNASNQVTGYQHSIQIIQAQFTKDNSNFVITNKNIGAYVTE